MNIFENIIRKIQTELIAHRNTVHGFEFGNVSTEDRAMAAARISGCDQGEIIGDDFVFPEIISGENSVQPTVELSRKVFRLIQRYFESASVEDRLKPWKVIGFMSDSMDPNGLAGRLHANDNTCHFINVTIGSFFHTLFAAYHVASHKGFEPNLPSSKGGLLLDTVFFLEKIRVPLDLERRQRAFDFAHMALKATFLHELAHVLRGHTLFVVANNGNSMVTEQSSDCEGQDSIELTRRVIETDADDFAGRFLADMEFSKFNKNEVTLDNPAFRQKAFDILVGVVLMYSWFPAGYGYHSGSIRAYIVMSSLFAHLGIDRKIAAQWLIERIDALQAILIQGGILPRTCAKIDDAEQEQLLNETLKAKEERQLDWLKLRPWDQKGN